MFEKQNSIIRRLFKSGLLLFAGPVLELAISFAAKILIARLLGRPAYGVAIIGITTLSFTSTILLFGMNTGVGRYLPHFDDDANRKGIMASGLQVVTGFSVGCGVLRFVFTGNISSGCRY